MARKALKVKQSNLKNRYLLFKKVNKDLKKFKLDFSKQKITVEEYNKQLGIVALSKKRIPSITKYYNRCNLCGRPRSYMREFGICRVCFRKYAREGMIMGVKKASW